MKTQFISSRGGVNASRSGVSLAATLFASLFAVGACAPGTSSEGNGDDTDSAGQGGSGPNQGGTGTGEGGLGGSASSGGTGGSPEAPMPAKRICIEAGSEVKPDPATLNGVYALNCAGCHGATGQGVGKFPKLTEDKGFEAFSKIVREGKEGTAAGVMPAFSESHLSESELLQVYVTLAGKTLKADRTLGCNGASPLDEAAIARAFETGLKEWRAPDHEDAACASCHGPMPIDLAYIGYDDATIFRRALKHISEAQTRAVIDFVHAIRAKYGIAGPKNFMEFRPFQPGGLIIGGATPAERDHKFGLNLKQAAPTLFDGVLDTKAEALKAKDELLAINPRTFPIGIALNRWTEDIHHGKEHGTLNEWIPDRPHIPVDKAAETALYALHDKYIANPTWENLWAIQDAGKTLTKLTGVTKPDAKAPGYNEHDDFAFRSYGLKYESVLFAQHHFLEELRGRPGLSKMSASPFPERNSLWELGDLARTRESVFFPNDCKGSWNTCLGLPADAVEKIDQAQNPRTMLKDLKVAWFWVGWFFDTTLYRTNKSNSTKVSEYFTAELYERGYFNHTVYHRFRKNLAAAYEHQGVAKDANGEPGIDHYWAHTYGYYMAYNRGIELEKMPKDPEALALYKTLAGNTFRMMMLLATEHIQRTGKVSDREVMRPIYRSTMPIAFSEKHESAETLAKTKQIVDEYEAAVDAACDRRPLRYGEQPYPKHCGP
ncbi:MAG: cytochrome c [Myxococcales bacterium]|nr:cytochrome c [Myxococcales bacterium]